MFEALLALGGTSAVLAGVTGYQAVKATLEQASYREGTVEALRKAYKAVVDEPVPDDMHELLNKLK